LSPALAGTTVSGFSVTVALDTLAPSDDVRVPMGIVGVVVIANVTINVSRSAFPRASGAYLFRGGADT